MKKKHYKTLSEYIA